jgi:hypothetical protein
MTLVVSFPSAVIEAVYPNVADSKIILKNDGQTLPLRWASAIAVTRSVGAYVGLMTRRHASGDIRVATGAQIYVSLTMLRD